MNKTKSLNKIRREYKLNKLSEETVQQNPFNQFEKWFELVLKMDFVEPSAMILATADNKARPSVRVVLLKGIKALHFSQIIKAEKDRNYCKILLLLCCFTGESLSGK
jgi:pyridoxine/pyridoxamine 5'-phosphate oxidase